MDIIRHSFGHNDRYLVAESGNRVVGVLPLVLFHTRVFGRFGVSIPFFNYGGVLVLYASATAQKWGSQRVGQIYGWLFSANVPASLAPVLTAATFDRTKTFTPALVALGAVLLGAGLVTRIRSAGLAAHAVPD
jgi:OFA family oxalate/formate antiporter-like MFS transporter